MFRLVTVFYGIVTVFLRLIYVKPRVQSTILLTFSSFV